MKSKIEGKSYVVWFDGERLPVKINRTATDKAFDRLTNAFCEIEKVLSETCKENPNLYKLLSSCLSDLRTSEVDKDGVPVTVTKTKQKLGFEAISLQTRNDSIPPEDELKTLADLGFTKRLGSEDIWEKIVENTKYKETVEEIIADWIPTRRYRTIMWEENEPKKKLAKTITYKNAPISKKLATVIKNTRS